MTWAGTAARPFDLAAGPLFRARLARLAAREHVLLICVHHAVFDGWSFGVFLRELAALYHARLAGRPADLPELPVQFADYTLWERQRLQGEVLENLVGYWREVLDGAAALELPTDRPRPLLQSFDGAVERLHIDADVLDGLNALRRREGTTLFVTLLTAVHAATEDSLVEACAQVRAAAASMLLDLQPVTWRHLHGWTTTLPLGVDAIRMCRTLDTGALAAAFPFASPDLPAPLPGDPPPLGGVLYGVNIASAGVVVWDRWSCDNHNSVILARSGAGK